MDSIISKSEAAKCFKVAVATFNKYLNEHPEITNGTTIIISRLKKIIEKECDINCTDKGR